MQECNEIALISAASPRLQTRNEKIDSHSEKARLEPASNKTKSQATRYMCSRSAINRFELCFASFFGHAFLSRLLREREENLTRKIAQSLAASLALTTNTATARILQLLRCSHRIGMARGSECDAGERIFPHYSCGRVCCVAVYGEKQQRIVSFHFVFSLESVKNGRRFGLELDVSFVNFPVFF